MTLAKFIKQLSQQNIDFKIWIEEWQSKLDQQQWEKPLGTLLDKTLVIAFCQTITPIIQGIISRTCTEELYEMRRESGHALFNATHDLAKTQGIEIELSEIDVPLTMTESMVAAGMVVVNDGKVTLTEAGEQAAQAVTEEITSAKK